MIKCPLCNTPNSSEYVEGNRNRLFKQCSNCLLLFAKYLPLLNEEKARYLEHHNNMSNKGYVQFLLETVNKALPYLSKEMQGLDYGCGPTPTLSVLLNQMGYQCNNYDPYFFPELPKESFDFIFASECFEHFFAPAIDMLKIKQVLKPNGILVISTDKWDNTTDFKHWHYTTDITHVSIYHSQTFRYIAQNFGLDIIENGKSRITILKNH